MVMACCISASVAVGFDLVARDASCLVCHRRFGGEDNPWDMVALFGDRTCLVELTFELQTECAVALPSLRVAAFLALGRAGRLLACRAPSAHSYGD